MPFNAGQEKAIFQRNASILVSAPAGSGKTKILVTRILELLKEGYELNELLVLTFTEAAGNEMKQRLSEDLKETIVNTKDEDLKLRLQRQTLLLPNAYITNFHGFCNTLLKKYGYIIDVLPGFEILVDTKQVKQMIFKQCLEQWVKNDEISDFIKLYYPGPYFNGLESTLFTLDEMSHSIYQFYNYVEKMDYDLYQSLDDFSTWPYMSYIVDLFKGEVTKALNNLAELRIFTEQNQITDFYERPDEQTDTMAKRAIPFDTFLDYLDTLNQELNQPIYSYDQLLRTLNRDIEKSYTLNQKEIDPQIKKVLASKRKKVLESLNKAKDMYLEVTEEEFIEKMKISQKPIQMLIGRGNLLEQFQIVYQQYKKEQNLLDFSDLETYTHKLLEPEYQIVQNLSAQFKEIMIDEYQDTNQIQETLIQKIATHDQHTIPLFMVGDMKQSIYRFRQADPQIFLDKYESFSLTDEDTLKTHTKRIDLVFNYRSSKVVLDSINYIFNQVMDKKVGGLDYYLDDSARLNYDFIGRYGSIEPQRTEFLSQEHLKTEIMLNVYDPASSLDKDQYEAHMVAQKIVDMKQNFLLKGKHVSYKDFVVLMRSTPAFITFKKVFDLYQIPNQIVLSQGFYSSLEVNTLMSSLRAFINPYDDIALTTLMTQNFAFSHIPFDLIAKERLNHDLSLYENMKESNDSTIQDFMAIFNEMSLYAHTHKPHQTVSEFFNRSGYKLFVSGLTNGQQRLANLELFETIINDKETSIPYLGDLLEDMKNSSDIAPAQASGQGDAVEFMTIHKSKGLEFPIVFVTGTHKQFNLADKRSNPIFDKMLGIAMKPRLWQEFNHERIAIEYSNSYLSLIAKHQEFASINEEMRILYVALTRASEKLILTGVIKSYDEITKIQEQILNNEDEDILSNSLAPHILFYDNARSTLTYLSWILLSTLRHPQMIEACLEIDELKDYALKIKGQNMHKHLVFDSTEHAMFDLEMTTDEELEKGIPTYTYVTPILNKEREQYDTHSFVEPTKAPIVSVTGLNHIHEERIMVTQDDPIPSSMKASERGTLVHLFMSYFTFKDDSFDQIMHYLRKNNIFNDLEVNELNLYRHKIESFINSDTYKDISQASVVYKEKKFSYYDESLEQIVHGIFDLVYRLNNEVYVLDYKTDNLSQQTSDEQLCLLHKEQLSYYQKVLKEIFNQDIKAQVYYLHLGKCITL